MKLGSILTEPVTALEESLHRAIDRQEEIKSAIIKLTGEATEIENVIKGYRLALKLLHEESNKI